MKKLIITTAILFSLTACNKTPDNAPSANTATESDQQKSDVQPNDGAMDQAKERKAEAAAIAHDRYDPDSIYEGADNIDIPPPQLKENYCRAKRLK